MSAHAAAGDEGTGIGASVTVTEPILDSVMVTPVDPVIEFVSGNPPSLQFIATAIYSDGSTVIVTSTANWTSSDDNVATIGINTGLLTTVAAGTATITATYNGTVGNTTLTVMPDTVPPAVTLTSPTEGLALGDTTLTISGTVDDLTATTSVTVNAGTTAALALGASGNFT
jgi:hypothetical protein